MKTLIVLILALAATATAQSCAGGTRDVCTCLATSGCGMCIGTNGGSILGCEFGNATGPTASSTCPGATAWEYQATSTLVSQCTAALNCGSNPAQSCQCYNQAGCGACVAPGGTGASCVSGNTQGPFNNALTCASGSWTFGTQPACTPPPPPSTTTNGGSPGSPASTGGGGASVAGPAAAACVPIVFIILIIMYWCVRGKHWWRSTDHKRCCYDESAVCNGCLCFHPYEAQPPPRGDGEGRKDMAVRVAPCFPHNPVAICANLDGKLPPEEVDAYNEAHPCGLGCGCRCYWVPGLCCWSPPAKCLKCCEDQMEGPPGGGSVSKKEKLKQKKKGLFGKKKDKNNAQPAV